ncbi:MAG: hypothetical protein ABI707_03290 [Ferruginibacter sp.]
MNLTKPATVRLKNEAAFLEVDPFGGAITAFQLTGNNINPLSFKFSKEQMPPNNKTGANYQGHFVCIGRWGRPSPGEIISGLPDHGEPANIEWVMEEKSKHALQMQAVAAKEGLQVDRTIVMDQHKPVFMVKETVTNINPLGRLFNMVQHPTLAAPFLDEKMIIDCNALNGFDQAHYKNILTNVIEWPLAKDDNNNIIDLKNPGSSYNAVYTLVVNPQDNYGWITSFSPTHNLLFGYVWKRDHYPWIHLWQHYTEDKIQYRGIEFGTAGIHQPFGEILDTATSVFGEKTFAYIDAGETITKSYFSFCHFANDGFTGVENVYFAKEQLIIKAKPGGDHFNIKLTQKLTDELQG